MKTLAIWDVDDTVIMINTLIGVKNDRGEVVEQITTADYSARAAAGNITADQCCFFDYRCSDKFYQEGTPHKKTLAILQDMLSRPEMYDVKLITARNFPTCIDTYLQKFTDHGCNISQDDVIFAADNSTGEQRTHTNLMKLPYYRQLVSSNIYNRVIGFEDNVRNLRCLHDVCVDYDVPFIGYVVDSSETYRQFTSLDMKD